MDSTLKPGRRALTLTVASAFFLLLLDSSILNTSLPRVAASMGVPPLALSATITGYLLASVAAMPLSGWLSAKFGGRVVYLQSIALFTLASAACGVSGELWQLVVARIVQGAAAGTMLTVGRAIALRDAETSELLSITSLLTWPALMAPVVGPPLGGWITTYLSWRWNFLLNVPIGPDGHAARAALRAARHEHAHLALRLARARRSRWVAWRRFSAASKLPRRRRGTRASSCPRRCSSTAGVFLLLAAMRYLERTPSPLISLAPLRVKTFALSTFTAGTYASMSLQATPYLLPLAFQLSFGASAAQAGAMLLPVLPRQPADEVGDHAGAARLRLQERAVARRRHRHDFDRRVRLSRRAHAVARGSRSCWPWPAPRDRCC